MKERPILFSGPMVRAILDGRKTQTRRVLTPQPTPPRAIYECDGADTIVSSHPLSLAHTGDGIPKVAVGFAWKMTKLNETSAPHQTGTGYKWLCPYGQPGDRLWVRETWGSIGTPLGNLRIGEGCRVFYRATEPEQIVNLEKWRPSIHMPRWASRIDLEISDIRVQPLQDISDGDALAEGVTLRGTTRYEGEARDAFHTLWGSINEERGHGWDTKPWVWALTFKALFKEGRKRSDVGLL